MRLSRIFYMVISGGLLFSSCESAESVADPADSFTRIYDDNRFEASYNPLDIVQTSDGGYLILGSRKTEISDFMGVYLMKVDEAGNFISEIDYSETLVHPLDEILLINNRFYMVAMDAVNLQAMLVSLEDTGETGTVLPLGGFQYPLGVGTDGNNIVLQSFNIDDKLTVMSVHNTTGQPLQTKTFSIGPGSDYVAPILDHFTQSGKQLPFKAGKLPGGAFYFNGFYNYTFSLVFTNLEDDEPQGVTQGQHEDGGISAVQPLQGQDFALSSFNFGTNFLMPRQSLNTSGISSATDLVSNPFPELVNDAPIELQLMTDSQNATRIVYGSHTRNGQMVLYSFDPTDGVLTGTKYLGYANQNELSGFTQTLDGGLAVLGKTYISGRFGRMIIYKLSTEETEELMK
jgi:hypothetical protein